MQIIPIVIGTDGNIFQYSTASSNGWIFSNGSGADSSGYKLTNKFSGDDGSWGFRLGDQVQGNSPGAYLKNGNTSFPSYGIENPNSSDSQQKHYWEYTGVDNSSNGYYSGNDYVGIAFSADYPS